MSENPNNAQYTENEIRSLDWKEHIRLRPGMYIGKLGDGNAADDGIYILIKEVIDNSIDEFVMGNGKTIDLTLILCLAGMQRRWTRSTSSCAFIACRRR